MRTEEQEKGLVSYELLSFSPEEMVFKKTYNPNDNENYYKLDLSASTNLTYESLINIVNNLYDLNITYGVYDADGNPGSGTLVRQALVLGSTNLAKLTDEETAIATNKGWNLS